MPLKLLKKLFEKQTKKRATAPVGIHASKKIQKHPLLISIGIALLTLFLAAAPHSAQAADALGRPTSPNSLPVPTATGQGVFDCLNSRYDWGCHILSFLFDNPDNPDSAVTYIKDGNEKTEYQKEHPTIGALKAVLGFFSSAILIVASIKLLYELLQMVAESAHSGQIGGRETNTLWAPIRLVVAIGLLVPLSSGLNSGQYIILQMAKWGSGLASQTWAVFAKQFTQNESLTAPTPPRIYRLAINIYKSYVCANLINYYAMGANLKDEYVYLGVDQRAIKNGNVARLAFGNKVDNSVCGHIDLKVPAQSKLNNPDAVVALQLTQINNDLFTSAVPNLEAEAAYTSQFFLPCNDPRDPNKPTGGPCINDLLQSTDARKGIMDAIQIYQDNTTQAITQARVDGDFVGRSTLKGITDQIMRAATERGWASAGTWFLAITRAQGQITSSGLNIPEATGPDLSVLNERYEAPSKAYAKFVTWLEESTRTNEGLYTKLDPGAGLSNETPFGEQTIQGESRFWRDISGIGEWTIDKVLTVLDKLAVSVGLWTDDPAKAFGDLGGSNNPFGEIAALGHKKLRLGLNYLGFAMLASAGGSIMEGGAKFLRQGVMGQGLIAQNLLKLFLNVIGKGLGVASILITSIASLFLIAGAILGFVVPLFPFTRFFFAILTWLGTFFEGMICLPFLALAHLTPSGQGFSGQNARTGYFLIFQIFLRPVLIILGLIASMLMFYIAAKFLNAMFYEATSGIAFYEGGMKFLQKLIYSLIYVGLIYISANLSFKMVEQIPRHALKWMGSQVSEEPYEDHNTFLQIAGAVGGQQLISTFTSMPKNVGDLAGFAPNAAGDIAAGRRADWTQRLSVMKSQGYTYNEKTGKFVPNYAHPEQIPGAERDLSNANSNLDTAHAAVEAAERNLGTAQTSGDPVRIAAATGAVTTARANLSTAQRRKDQAQIRYNEVTRRKGEEE